jgi:hypothetical protein
MRVAAVCLLIASFSAGVEAQDTGEKPAPGLDVVKLEVSMVRIPDLGESPTPRADPGTLRGQSDVSQPREGGLRTTGDNPATPRTEQVQPGRTRTSDPKAFDPKVMKDRSRYRFYATLVLTNSGAKAIKSVGWDYVLTDPEAKQEIGRFGFRTRKKIEPGRTITITQQVRPSTGDRRVVINRIEYSDGTTWDRSQERS